MLGSCEDGNARDVGTGLAVRAGTGDGIRLGGRDREETMGREVLQIQESFEGWEGWVSENM